MCPTTETHASPGENSQALAHMADSVSLLLWKTDFCFSSTTFHEKTRFTLSTLRSPVIVVGSRKTRCEVNNGVNSVLSTGQGKPCAVYGEWALKDTCLEGWMARLLFEAAIAWWDLLQLHVTWLDSRWVMRVGRQRLTPLSPLTSSHFWQPCYVEVQSLIFAVKMDATRCW